VTTVERSLQAAEILQAVGNKKEKERAKWMKAAGLTEIRRITVTKNKLRCILSVMQPIPESAPVLSESSSSVGTESVNDEGADGLQTSIPLAKKSKSQHDVVPRFSAGELVLGFMDDCPSDSTGSGNLSVRELLCSMTQEGEQLSLNSVGLVAEEVTVQPVLLSMAVQALTQLTDLIAPAPAPASAPAVQEDEAVGEGGVNIDDEDHVTVSDVKSTSRINIDINADGAGRAIGEGEGEERGEGEGVESVEESMPILSAAGLPLPSKITIVGQSFSHSINLWPVLLLMLLPVLSPCRYPPFLFLPYLTVICCDMSFAFHVCLYTLHTNMTSTSIHPAIHACISVFIYIRMYVCMYVCTNIFTIDLI
jgi:hypothetical protein